MKRTIIKTADNSKTLLIDGTDVTYHSKHGAITESNHIFINYGIDSFKNKDDIKIFEMGFGTGLNAVLTMDYAIDNKKRIEYDSIEKYPLSQKEIDAYQEGLSLELVGKYSEIHKSKWDEAIKLSSNFILKKINNDLLKQVLLQNKYDLIFFDAFGPGYQPELWKPNVLLNLFKGLKQGGELITYCAQGQFKRDLKSVGFIVENLPGPPGKREITRGVKA